MTIPIAPSGVLTSADVLSSFNTVARAAKLASMLDDGASTAATASLRYVDPKEPGYLRRRRGRGHVLLDERGQVVRAARVLTRIRKLALPPAWHDVWICRDEDGHIQAIGRDARGRKQYRYHARWRAVRDAANYDRLREFYKALPRLRSAVSRDLACRCPCKTKVAAAAVALIERGHLRVGNDQYTRANGSYGATTLLARHAQVHGHTVELDFVAKGGKRRAIRFRDARLARVIGQLKAERGARLFQYRDGSRRRVLSSNDVNEYLHTHAGVSCSAKVFRTWGATVAAALALAEAPAVEGITARKRVTLQVVRAVSQRLGNTPAVCRKSYIHPLLLARYMTGDLDESLARLQRARARDESRAEAMVVQMLAA
ncbi:MAG: DNA topoisomerase IB [Deltaproteobacteria bacterium]|nr:DNA topoisomerase IB [Nannocystaceae bacterium]